MRTLYKFPSLWPVSWFTDISTQQSSQFQNNKMLTIPCGSCTNKNYEERWRTVQKQYLLGIADLFCFFHTVLKPHTFILPNPFFVCCHPILCPGRLTLKADLHLSSASGRYWQTMGSWSRKGFGSSFLTACLSQCCDSACGPPVTTSPVRWYSSRPLWGHHFPSLFPQSWDWGWLLSIANLEPLDSLILFTFVSHPFLKIFVEVILENFCVLWEIWLTDIQDVMFLIDFYFVWLECG